MFKKYKQVLSVIITFGLAMNICACEKNTKNSSVNSKETNPIENIDSTNNTEQMDVYSGPGTDYLLIGSTSKDKISKAVKIENNWVEIEFDGKRGYVTKDSILELCTDKIPRVVYSINQNVHPYPVIYNINAQISLFDDAKTYYSPKATAASETIEAGENITILCSEKSNINNYAQIEVNTDGKKRRCYSNVIDLLSLDNPLLNFEYVKNTNAIITYNDIEYYSSSGEATALSNGWHKTDETTISKTEWDILAGITNIIKSNDLNSEIIKSTEGKIQLYSFKNNQYINANIKDKLKSNISDVVDFLVGGSISFIQGAKDTLNLKIEFNEYSNEHKIVIKAGSPIESQYAGKKLSLSSLIVEKNNTALTMVESSKRADEIIKLMYPNLEKNKVYSMDMKFSKDFDNNYGYYLVIDNNLNIYAVPIIHNGTSFAIYSEGKFISDAVWDLASSMIQLDDDSATKILELLSENGFIINGFKDNDTATSIFESMPKSFDFSSGVGAWGTHIDIEMDGSFVGEYHDTDMGDTGDGYPNGTVYICNFNGKFSTPEQIDEYRYSTKLEFLEIEEIPGNEYYEDNMRYISSEPYGLENADDFLIYLPGCPLNNVSEEFLSWSFINTEIIETLPFNYYGLYNVQGMKGFVGME